MEELIGRKEEREQLREVLLSREASFVAVYGRRRVGKTFLIREFFKHQFFIEYAGIHDATYRVQLEGFILMMTELTKDKLPSGIPSSWMEAFQLLRHVVTPRLAKEKVVIFFDEFPWLHTPRSGFGPAFEHFWNSWGSRQPNLIVIICGSAASWMIRRVVNNKGGLHNRLTKTIQLFPFTLRETEQYLKSRKIALTRYHVLQLYMVMGGIPHYLKQVKAGQSAVQNIDRLCFTRNAILSMEFGRLYQSLFDGAEKHVSIIRALARKHIGLTRNEIIVACKLRSGGGTTYLLDELEQSGFITAYTPFGKTSKDNIYKISDEYSLFYLRFIEPNQDGGPGTWGTIATGASWRSWSGIAFESICQKHISAIKTALGIPAVYTRVSAWRWHSKAGQSGTQIDLLIDRKDDCINICEMKFSETEFVIQKSYSTELDTKLRVFKERTATRKQLFLTMITTYGVKENEYKVAQVSNDLTMDALFEG
ncbi:AAA family ATPase [Puia dinghuensis]|uniref:ATPase n=1 Tax=Puia dinghuensis TaxID=1792502 RepID=A0A8J2UEL9_9BACT|nr:ATP-binding protein [Puia dinghuensis]GGB07035.1 ATPase [Puia dinghuensis]